MAIKSKFSPATPVYLNGALAYENEVPGFPSKVLTWGHRLAWREVTCPVSREIVAEKRDHFNKRSELCFTIADAGVFEVAVAYAPNVSGGTTKRPLKCLLCGATHNWCVFYRRAADGHFLGYSGCDCFGEVCANIQLPNTDAVAKYVGEERARCERFRRTMDKVNDFKSLFPGLYENREWLGGYANPYRRLWQEVENQLNRGEGVTPEWLDDCRNGKLDRIHRWRSDNAARLVPDFLNELTEGVAQNGFKATAEALVEKSHCEPYGTRWHRPRPQAAAPVATTPITPAQIAGPVIPQQVNTPIAAPAAQGKPTAADNAAYLDSKGYGWSSLVARAKRGHSMSIAQERWLAERRVEEEAKAAKPKDPQADLPDTPRSRPGIQVGDDE